MRLIGGGWRQHDLGIRGELDHARARTRIGHRDSPHFGIVFGGHHHIERGGQRTVAPHELCAIFREGHLVAVRHHTRGLPCG